MRLFINCAQNMTQSLFLKPLFFNFLFFNFSFSNSWLFKFLVFKSLAFKAITVGLGLFVFLGLPIVMPFMLPAASAQSLSQQPQQRQLTQQMQQSTEQVVRELMQQEAELLQQERLRRQHERNQYGAGQLPNHADLSASSSAGVLDFRVPTETTQLMALYGVGGQVAVTIRHLGQVYVFPPGQTQPLAGGQDESLPKIEKRQGRCVILTVGQETLRRCIKPTLP